MENKFAIRLKELRTEKGVNQILLAEKLQVSKGIISFWENGLREPTLSNLLAIAKFFNVSLDFLAGLVDY